MQYFIMKSSLCPCCFTVFVGARLNIRNLGTLFEELCSEKLEDQQLNKTVDICYKCYTRLKLAFLYRKFFRDLLIRLKRNDPLPKGEVQSDVVDVPVAERCPVCLVKHPTVQHVYEHLQYTQRSYGCDTNVPNTTQNYHQLIQSNPYTGQSYTVPIVYYCSAACGASFVRRGLLDVHQLMCRNAQLAYEESESFCENRTNTAADETTTSDTDESHWEDPSQHLIQKQSTSEGSPSNDVLSHTYVGKPRNATNRVNDRNTHSSPKEKQTSDSLPVKSASSDRIYYKKFCTICEKWFHKLNVHLRTHSVSRHYECKLCHKSLTNEVAFKDHESYHCPLLKNRASNAERNPFVCTICGRSYRLNCFLVQHMKAHVKVPCSVCNKMYSKSSIRPHILFEHSNEKIICDYCGKSMKNRYVLKTHIKLNHRSDVHMFQCEKCGKECKQKSDLKKHLTTHDVGQREHQCKLCNLTFFARHSLYMHTNVVHKKSWSRNCTICGLTLSSPNTLKVHERKHTGIKPFACDECGKAFTQKPALTRHRRSQHGVMPSLVEKCPHCDQMFSSKKTLKSHIVRVH